MSIEHPEAGIEYDRIAVAMRIDNEELRRRALQAVTALDERFVLIAAPRRADVLITDHLLGAYEDECLQPDLLPASLPAVVIGDQATIDVAMRRGYAGGLLPSFSSTKLRLAIEAAAHGLVCTDAPRESMPLLDDEGDAELIVPELTVREVEVLQQLITGASNKEIARRLEMSVHTAKFHVASIAAKLGASGRTDVVARALRLARSMI